MMTSHLRVAFDMTPVVAGDTGVSRYTRELFGRLAADPSLALLPFAVGRGPEAPVELRRVHWPLRTIHAAWRAVGRPTAEALVGDVDLVHSVDVIAPPTARPLVMTVHDALPVTDPQWYGPRHRRIGQARLRSLHRAKAVTVTCEATAAAVAAATGFPRARMLIAPPGPRPLNGGGPPLVPAPYLLAVGAVTPRKGFEILAEALALLDGPPPTVVVAGPDGWRADSVHQRVAALGVDGSFRFMGRVDDATLVNLYRHADLLCHPSFAEGFGMPCLEAMACGVPVVAADIPPVREVTAGAAALVPPDDATALAEAITAVVGHDDRRAAMRAAGLARAAEYSWDRTAAATIEAYRRAAR